MEKKQTYTAGLVLGILSIPCGIIIALSGWVLGIVGIVFGALGAIYYSYIGVAFASLITQFLRASLITYFAKNQAKESA